METFGLVTLWQSGHHVVRVEAGMFPSPEAARKFCGQPLVLASDLASAHLVVTNSLGETLAVAGDEQVCVFHLTPEILRDFGESRALLTSQPLYQHVELPIADFHRHVGFRAFQWMACAVREPVKLTTDDAR